MNPNSFDPISIAVFLAALSLLPLLLICTTCFLKVSMVLIIVRNAIGVQQVPPSIAIYGIALSITLFVMAPVFNEVMNNLPGREKLAQMPGQYSVDDLAVAAEPMRRFMIGNTAPEKRAHFLAMAKRQWRNHAMGEQARDTDYVILIPAFVVSELELAFQIGFVLYVPFVVIDLLLSNILLALGMQMVSPMVVSLPLKMLLFVMLEGWTKLTDGLMRSYS